MEPVISNIDEFVRACGVRDLADGDVERLEFDDTAVCIARVAGVFYAIDDRCSHAGASLSEGCLDGGVIECWMHGARFNLATGKVEEPPAEKPVTVYQTLVQGEDVMIRLGSSAESADT